MIQWIMGFFGKRGCFYGLICLILALSRGAYPQTQEIIPLSSEIYREMDALYLLRGLGSPSSSRPWTAAEALAALERVDAAGPRLGEQALHDHIAAEISRLPRLALGDSVHLDANFETAFEVYAHTNDRDYVTEPDWLYGYEERKPLFLLSAEMAAGKWFYVFTDLRYGRNRFLEGDIRRDETALPGGMGALIPPQDTFQGGLLFPVWSWAYSRPVLTNVIPRTWDFDFQWPKRAVFAVGGNHWTLNLSRDKIRWGSGHTGNFIIDDHTDYQDFARFSVFTERFKYEWLNVFFISYPYNSGLIDSGGLMEETFRILMAHRLEFRILKSLSFSISENIMYQDRNLNFRYFNPAFIYHNLWDRSRFNAIAQGELEFTFAPGFKVYGQFVIDQLRAPDEDAGQSDAYGVLAGFEHARTLGKGVLTISLEGAYTTPLLYRRDKVDFLMITKNETLGAWESFYVDYIGYPYGGDAAVLQLDAAYLLPGDAVVSARFLGMIHGRMNFFISHNSEGDNTEKANLPDHTPSGGRDQREMTFIASFRGDRKIPQPLSWLNLSTWARLDLITKGNKLMYSRTGIGEDLVYHRGGVSTDLQFTIGLALRL
ncbi:MAG: hypothetical protein LBP32_04985 [Spirochaetaceae bacterium]|jgi:hypothetical protein|nr:hypothetical protein [Spirochaetaceae bacterium]